MNVRTALYGGLSAPDRRRGHSLLPWTCSLSVSLSIPPAFVLFLLCTCCGCQTRRVNHGRVTPQACDRSHARPIPVPRARLPAPPAIPAEPSRDEILQSFPKLS